MKSKGKKEAESLEAVLVEPMDAQDFDFRKSNFQCSYCSRDFKDNYHLQRHLATHDPAYKNLKCELCDKCFSTRDKLGKHLAVHLSSLKKFKCKFCDQRFCDSYRLNRHMRSHRNGATRNVVGVKRHEDLRVTFIRSKTDSTATRPYSLFVHQEAPTDDPIEQCLAPKQDLSREEQQPSASSSCQGWDSGSEEGATLDEVSAGPVLGQDFPPADAAQEENNIELPSGPSDSSTAKRKWSEAYVEKCKRRKNANVQSQEEVVADGGVKTNTSRESLIDSANPTGQTRSPDLPSVHLPTTIASRSALVVESESELPSTGDVGIDDLLGSDSEEESEVERPTFAKEEIVWEVWYRNSRSTVAVRDEDLLFDPLGRANRGASVVFSQLSMVTSVQTVRGNEVMLGLLALTDGMEPVNMNQPGRVVSAKLVRKFGQYVQDKMILNSQRSATHFLVLKSIYGDAQSYTYLHLNLKRKKGDGLLSPKEFFSLDYLGRQQYIARLSGLNQPTVNKPAAFSEGELNQSVSCSTAVPVEDVLEAAALSETSPSSDVLIDGCNLSPALRAIVAELPPTWPLDWVGQEDEVARLQRIMRGEQISRRHQLFFVAKQRQVHGQVSDLVQKSNPSFMTIFQAGALTDRSVQSALLSTVFEPQIRRRDTDRQLRHFAKASSSVTVRTMYSRYVIQPVLL